MGDNFQEMRRLMLGDHPNTMRMSQYYLIDIGIFEDNISAEWQRAREYGEGWQWQDGQNEPTEPQPACPEAVKNLPTFAIQTEGKDCAICLTDFKKNEMVKSMPCQHMFHEICILTWLNQNNTCPFCRYRLPSKIN